MYISHLDIQNWRNFQEFSIDLQKRVFIVGPNASGKSNFLDIIRFLRDVTKIGGGLQEAVRTRGGVSKIRSLSARAHSDIEIGVTLADDRSDEPLWKYSLSFTQVGGGVFKTRAKLKQERVEKLDGTFSMQRPDDKDERDEKLLEYTFLEQPNANSAFRDVADFFQGIQYLHIIPQFLRDPNSFLKMSTDEDFYGRDLIERINKTNINTQRSNLRKIQNALVKAVPQFRELSLQKDEMGIPHLQAVYQHWRGRGAKQWEDQFSDGTLRLIGFLWSLLDGTRPLLLEEPELSLHSGVVSSLPDVISKLQKKKSGIRQVLLSTHSYDLLKNVGIAGEEVVVLEPKGEGTDVKLATAEKEIMVLLKSGMNIADIVIPKTTPPKISQLSLEL